MTEPHSYRELISIERLSMKAISFLGIADYKETTFTYKGDEHRTRLFPAALCKFLKPDDLLVLVTDRARNKWLSSLDDEVRPMGIVPKAVDIPEGHSIDDLWEIFQQLTAHLDERDDLIFDITYSFRTLPFLAFLAASYLRVAKQVSLKGVLDGAWEARRPMSNPPEPTDRSPVFDLSPFMNLLTLTTSTDQFLKTGNAQSLVNLLPIEENSKPLIQSVSNIARGLELLRPNDVMREAAAITNHIDAAIPAIETEIPPIAPLIRRVSAEYGGFAVAQSAENSGQNTLDKARLGRQLRMVKWYADRGQFVHALSMAREWLPSLLCWKFNADPTAVKEREDMELLLAGGIIKDSATGATIKESPRLKQWNDLDASKRKALAKLWGGSLNLANLRNDVLHSGFRKNPRSSQAIEKDSLEVVQELMKIAKDWELSE